MLLHGRVPQRLGGGANCRHPGAVYGPWAQWSSIFTAVFVDVIGFSR